MFPHAHSGSGASLAASLLTLALTLSTATAAGQGSQPPTTFRSGVNLVPVDVRVVDTRTGKPVTDLRQDEFTVIEDGVRQRLSHFFSQALVADLAAVQMPLVTPTAAARRTESTPRTSIPPQHRRVFLIVLGNGRLQGPSKGLDGLLRFLRTSLLPQDRVAIYAYDRATDFTVDHEKIAALVERFKEENDAITTEADFRSEGLQAIYGSGELPDSVQQRIDRVFFGVGGPPEAEIGHTERANADRVRRDARRQGEAALDAAIASGRLTPQAESGPGSTSALSWGAFDNFVARNGQTLRDLGNLYAAIAYMREIDGEKHLVFVTESGLSSQRLGLLGTRRFEEDKDVAMMAADGRIAIDVIQTGGLDESASGMFARQGLRALSEDTGGLSSVTAPAAPAFDRLDAVTRTTYVLGYYPSNTRWDGSYRSIVVKVSRPDVSVICRRGYHSFTTVPGFDRREYITRHRVEAASVYSKDVRDIHVRLKASLSIVNGQPMADVNATIDPGRLYFSMRKGVRFGQIDIAVIAMDQDRNVLGGTYKKQVAHLEYDEPTFKLVKQGGIPYRVKMPVPSGTRYVRVVVYDYMFDLVGSAGAWVY